MTISTAQQRSHRVVEPQGKHQNISRGLATSADDPTLDDNTPAAARRDRNPDASRFDTRPLPV
ncbi:MAG: hypothetical protein WAV02_23035 [Stellaceae bacterium]